MNNIVERLRDRRYGDVPAMRHDAADMIEQQAERIKELETELERERMRLAACGSAALGYFDGCKDEYRSASLDDVLRLREQLTALRKKIKDAPVVAWALTNGDVTNNESAFLAHAFQGNSATPLVSKEDLQK